MFEVINLVTPLFTIIFLGFISGKLIKLPVEGLVWLSFFVVYIALPALFFQLLAKTPVAEFNNVSFLVMTTLATFCVFALCFFIGRIINKSNTRESTVQGFAGAYGNIGYMGPPLAIAAFGPEAGVPVALIFCLDNAMHFTLAPSLMALGEEKRVAFLPMCFNIVKKIITHPFILATIAGMCAAFMQYEPRGAINTLLNTLSAAAAPAALFALGVTAALRPIKRVPMELAYLIPIKLIVHPVLMYFMVAWIPGISDVWIYTAVLLASLPSATNVFVIAQQYGVWEERASSAVAISTLISIASVTLYLYLAKKGLI